MILRILYRLLLHFWYIPVMAVLVFLFFHFDLWKELSVKKITVKNTPVEIEKITAIGQLITANYYGESLASLQDAYEDLDLSELGGHYERFRLEVLQKRKIETDRYYYLLKHIAGIDRRVHFEQVLAASPWNTFYHQHETALHEAMAKYAGQQSGREELVYLGRGTVSAGIDLSALEQQHLQWRHDTLYIHNVIPCITDAVINPWYIPENKMPGFQLVLAEKEARLAFDQIMLVKEACIDKLKREAIANGILESALRNAEKELVGLLAYGSHRPMAIRLEPTALYNELATVTSDSLVSKQEVNELAGLLSSDTSGTASALVKNIARRTKSTDGHHSVWRELLHHLAHEKPLRELAHWKHVAQSPHAQHHQQYAALGNKTESEWDKHHQFVHAKPASHEKLRDERYKTFGWHPYYMGTAYKSYRFDLLWGMAYWGVVIDPYSGNAQSTNQWETASVVDAAKAAGTKVFLTVSNFGGAGNRTFFTNPHAQQKLLDNIATWLAMRKADGVCIDFEDVPGSVKDAFNAWLVKLAERMHDAGYEITLCLYAVDFAHVFDIAQLKDKIDLFTIMGYDYYYAGSKTTGPVAPLDKSQGILPYTLEQSVDYYLQQGVPNDRLVLALPYYGREWKAASETYPTANLGFVNALTYRQIMQKKSSIDGKELPGNDTKVFVSEQNGETFQLWYDDAETLKQKFRWIKTKGIAGPGIWALGYDNGYPELWKEIEDEFGREK